MTAFRNKSRARQLIEFDNLRYGTKIPTDIDCFMDFGGRAFVFIEAKYGDAPLPLGQRLALERLCDAIDSRIDSYVLVARHTTPSGADIDLATAMVTEYRYDREWHHIEVRYTVRQFLDWANGRLQ
jgi:hypothetical protein